ncbi:hypothetical protein DEJ49_21795 [Streptomyces venezuelae]|uniref:Barstar (barnase inhibitor) domain-containing protein n=1 Tax=Streptomyces venezuelae TaxID=54571 RepID=A0A5P2CLT0_STRVZ|nr:barstar family protein [Streptomyces venezuelae]QES43270.1 hypothetical protein DEJ49_21795 [Streptomyces venezuelae]
MAWDAWWSGRPTEPNLWARDGTGAEGRSHWLAIAREHAKQHTPADAPDPTYHLDGRHITDEPAFYRALGEAVHGPGGYAGRSADTLADCLRRTTDTPSPRTLAWHTAHTARTCLGVTPRTDDRTRTFEELLSLLRQMNIEMVLA